MTKIELFDLVLDLDITRQVALEEATTDNMDDEVKRQKMEDTKMIYTTFHGLLQTKNIDDKGYLTLDNLIDQ